MTFYGININTIIQTLTAIGIGGLAIYLTNQHTQAMRDLYKKSKNLTSGNNNNNNYNNNSGDQSSQGIVDLFRNTLIEFILSDETNNVVTIDSQATLDYALMSLNENNVSSLPVVDLEHKKYIGTLSIVDIAAYVGKFPNQDTPNTLVSEVLKYNREPFVPLYVNSSIQLLIHIMTHVNNCQVPIMSQNGIVVDMVSRRSLLKFVHENIECLGSKSNNTVKSLDLLSNTISTIDSNQKVIDAINILNRDHITELAVIDPETSKLVGSFSASDLRKLSTYTFNRCYEPISKFINLDSDAVILASPNSSLRLVIKKFVENDCEILWITDASMKPVSSITQISIMKYFLHAITEQPIQN
ncbi:hypothetical protein DLAC_07257 [Tieghemostelium lacteum]|uniref:CBS domain-containing protein n=1 Tax=Tieghemostelium lacteum TaxID=361077 RepID=A0A151ZC39_TIELA|nr:hypothetical protein DLAC_07257 [Tieghemostelium lacteum]|eukprot:KYQ91499.1 hypothetical protein DLAC_07257 [Tieghemostelium lacteum]